MPRVILSPLERGGKKHEAQAAKVVRECIDSWKAGDRSQPTSFVPNKPKRSKRTPQEGSSRQFLKSEGGLEKYQRVHPCDLVSTDRMKTNTAQKGRLAYAMDIIGLLYYS